MILLNVFYLNIHLCTNWTLNARFIFGFFCIKKILPPTKRQFAHKNNRTQARTHMHYIYTFALPSHYSASFFFLFFFFSFFFSFCFCWLSGCLVEIRWSVCVSKSQRILCVSFSRMDSGLCICYLFVWPNLNFLHNSRWIAFPTESSEVLFSFCANLLL